MITREDLENAALEAGHEIVCELDAILGRDVAGAACGAVLLRRVQAPWRPHLDDGDAFRLILQLDLWLVVSQRYQSVSVRQNMDERDGHKGTEAFCVEHDGTKADTARAARDAVVLCAAEIGRRMKGGA